MDYSFKLTIALLDTLDTEVHHYVFNLKIFGRDKSSV